MSKKLILLMLALPLIIMLSLYTTTSTVSLNVKVPVDRLEVHVNDIVELNLDEGETYPLNEHVYTVYPTNAANKEILFSSKPIEGQSFANLTYDAETMTILPLSSGWATVTLTTVDGAKSDDFILRVTSKDLEAIESYLEKDTLFLGEKTKIVTSFLPKNAKHKQLTYAVVAGEECVEVNPTTGVVTAIGVGEATIRVTSAFNTAITYDVTVQVSGKTPIAFTAKNVSTRLLSGSIPLYIDENATDVETILKVFNSKEEELSVSDIFTAYLINKESKRLEFTFKDANYYDILFLRLHMTRGEAVFEDTCVLTRTDLMHAYWNTGDRTEPVDLKLNLSVGQTTTMPFAFNLMEGVAFEYKLLDEKGTEWVDNTSPNGLVSVSMDQAKQQLSVTAVKAGTETNKVTLILRVWETDAPGEYVDLTLTITIVG